MHHPRTPRDLDPAEQVVADWFSTLDRNDAPDGLRRAVVAGAGGKAARPAGRLLRMVPFGAWGIASAALVLLAVGAAVTVELATPAAAPAGYEGTTWVERHSPIVRNDPAMSLFHGRYEIFDEIGLPQGEVIAAGWGR